MDLQAAVKTFFGKIRSDITECPAIPANLHIQTQTQVLHYTSSYSFVIYISLLSVRQLVKSVEDQKETQLHYYM